MRVWPLDFNEYYVQTQHTGSIISVQSSSDGLKIFVASSDGCVGMLDLTNSNYKTLMRSHVGDIHRYRQNEYFQLNCFCFCLEFCLFVCLFVGLFIFCLLVYFLGICLFVCLFVCFFLEFVFEFYFKTSIQIDSLSVHPLVSANEFATASRFVYLKKEKKNHKNKQTNKQKLKKIIVCVGLWIRVRLCQDMWDENYDFM